MPGGSRRENNSQRIRRPSVCGFLAGTAAYNEKSGPCRAATNFSRVQLPGSGAIFLMLLHFLGLSNSRIWRRSFWRR